MTMKLFPILMIARGALVLALALFAVHLARRAAASLRYTVLAAALGAVLVLPVIELVVPTWHSGAIESGPALFEAPAMPVAETAGFATEAAPVLAPPAPVTSSPIPWLGAIWMLGAAGLLLRVIVGAARARGIARRGEPVRGVGVMAVWRALDGRSDPPRIVASDEIDAPIVVGALAPVVVVPRASSEWSAERWRVVLMHELAHVRRRDGLANLVSQLACCLHWVSPLAWIAARRMREERELAADDVVLRGGERASTYAEHLIAIATAAPSAAPVAVLGMASGFEARVVALLDADRSRRPAGRRALAVASIALLVTAAAACFSPDSPPVKTGDDGVVTGAPPVAKDSALQSAAEAELDAVMTTHHASGAIAIVLDAKTGAPLVVATRGDGDARAARTPGSTMKPFTFAAALEAGVVDSSTRLDCGVERKYGDRTLRDAAKNGVLDLGGILAVSSNVCTAQIVEKLDGDKFASTLQRYHLAPPARIDTHSFEGAAIGFGEGIRISALDLASAYTAIADGGMYHARDGRSERAISESAARTTLALLEHPVTDAAGTARAALIEGIRVAGKTGTASSGRGYYASFVGIVPADAPRFVVLVGVDGVESQGGKVAAPAFAKIAARALTPQTP